MPPGWPILIASGDVYAVKTMKYVTVLERDRTEIEILLRSSDVSDVLNALLSAAYYDSDWRWVQNRCLNFLTHEDRDVRALAATCLGHIARIHGKLELDIVLGRLTPLKADPMIGGSVQDALDDIKFFLKFQ